MNLQKLALASALALASITSFAAPVAGKSSNPAYINVGSSTFQGNNEAGVGFPATNPPDGTTAALSSLKNGPILQTDNAYATQAGPDYFIEFNVSGSTLRMAQTWRNLSAPNGTEIYTWRQIDDPVGANRPHFGNTSIAKVSGHEVYFGEWVPKATSPVYGSSTNMVGQDDSLRTVFFVGENPTTSMPTLVNAKYDVVALKQYNPGTQAGVHTGVLNVNYSGGSGTIAGSLAGVNLSANISSDGSFNNGANGTTHGQFYGTNASAVAGYYNGVGPNNDFAFGGTKR
ncbi:Slam-dependent surface lipoprotein [Pseudomonas aeruginosa]|uniref:Slam-dependent surface lipoprotein n=1 Tax=Pseudomonas TaxID=286 RepID=UPI001F49E252|nr:Slam-dependent surface lipoprotein [Pseudomonas aeruginosa]WOU21162.1 Slam-dependent surface lipoprotein [Pseudomonas aeruginosa]WOU34826.1 Slam-dependent surface lipoprotein [Pseudomonas aeruginosa]HEK0639920.1 hypothetical protein [Proteus mirabilis]